MFFWNSLAFSMIQRMLAIWSLVPLPFLKPAWTSGHSWFMYCWSLVWRILCITLLACEINNAPQKRLLGQWQLNHTNAFLRHLSLCSRNAVCILPILCTQELQFFKVNNFYWLIKKRLSEFVFCLFLSLFCKSLAVKFHDDWEIGAAVICTEVPVVLLLHRLCKCPQSVKGKWHPRVHVKMLGDTWMCSVELPRIYNSHY